MHLKVSALLQGGKYRIEFVLGQGGFGITYLAVQTGLNRKVAIKEFFMKEHCNRDADTSHVSVPSIGSKDLVEKFRVKFIKEAQTIASLSHPNIIRIHDIFEENGTAYYVMEYHGSGSLADMDLPMLIDKALGYVRQIGSALDYLHSRNVMHLDVKPSNVLVDDASNAVLIDFGVSKRYDESGHQTSSTPVGISHGYAPIEQYSQSTLTFSPATDIYALGATLYKLLTGQTPPESSLLLSNPSLLSFPEDAPASLVALVRKCMRPVLDDRPQSIEEFLRLLGAAAKEENEREEDEIVGHDDQDETKVVVSEHDEPTPVPPAPVPAPRKRRPWLWLSLLLLLGVLAGVFYFGSFSDLSEDDLSVLAAEELYSSAKGLGETANCYIVSSSGKYKFKTVKGNSKESVGQVVLAEVLWESFGTSTTPNVGDLIKSVSYEDGYIVFQTADAFKEGNAVIAAKDASGTILWSWHIWLTDQPQGQVYYNNAGTMMDRNLGATSATPGDVGALGLLYQWGRKDPFLGSSSILSSRIDESTIAWPSAVSSNSSKGTIAYATANPTTFITYNSSNYDWYYTGSSSTDDTRWTTSDKTKSIYDPCPAGWRVPDGGDNGVWSKALGSSSDFEQEYSSSNEGMNFSLKFGSASTIWYPASGYCVNSDGRLALVGSSGDYWSASPYNSSAYGLDFSRNGSVNPSYYYFRAYGQSVRCLQE